MPRRNDEVAKLQAEARAMREDMEKFISKPIFATKDFYILCAKLVACMKKNEELVESIFQHSGPI